MKNMMDPSTLKSKLRELEQRAWDRAAIESRCRNLEANGIPGRTLNRDILTFNRLEILDRVQRRAEEYNFILRNCAKSTALAIMEEFGLGNLEIVKALSPFPGFGGMGWMCGGVTGGLIALGLYAGSDTLTDQAAVGRTMMLARQFMPRFEAELGAVTCPQIQEKDIFGRYMDPGASPENMQAFEQARGFEKCSLVPGIGARIASELIIEDIS
jgi:C_GCAxxG_C_C family probable redox protein